MEENKNIDQPSECLTEIINIFPKYQLTIEDLIAIFANIGYSIGASIEGYGSDVAGPSPEEVMRLHATNPERVGIALMQLSLDVSQWVNQLEAAEELKKKREENEVAKV